MVKVRAYNFHVFMYCSCICHDLTIQKLLNHSVCYAASALTRASARPVKRTSVSFSS
jgi:hypothetical protein